MLATSPCVSFPPVFLFGCVHLLGSPLSFQLQPACYVGHGVSFLGGVRRICNFFFKSEDGVTIFIITVDTYMKHVVPLSLAVVIRLLVAFGREHVHRRQWNIGTVPCGIPGPSRLVLTTLISNVFSTFLRYILCSTRSTAFLSVVGDH
jgi:hypothetical protein